MAQPRRNGTSKGFAHAGGMVSSRIQQASSSRGFAETRLLTHWAEIVGPELAHITKPSKVSFPRGGLGATLVVLTSGARAPEVQMQAEAIRSRVNACYGYNAIAKLRVTQTDASTPGFSEAQSSFNGPASKKKPDHAKISELDLEDVRDAGLRAALESLSETVLTK